MKVITLFPERFKQFGNSENTVFCLITNGDYISNFDIKNQGQYTDFLKIPYDKENNIETILKEQIPEKAHILVISPNCYFSSPKPAILGKNRKLCIMACNSTPTSLHAIEHFLKHGENTNPEYLDKVAEKFFLLGENSKEFIFIDDDYNTKASFKHLSPTIQWHQQAGTLAWGEQQLYPSGEISALPIDVYNMDIESSLELDGEIVLRGFPVLHSGKSSYLKKDQKRIFDQLKFINDNPIIATIEHGIISRLTETTKKSKDLILLFEAMFAIDSRYRTIIEIGFGINHWVELFPDNSAMNEVFALDKGGSIHWGIGLTPHTQYHLDLICPNTSVINEKREIIFGKDNKFYDTL